MLRPRTCRWFELVTTHAEMGAVLQALAHEGAVELQTHDASAAPPVIEGAERLLDKVREARRRYGAYWPAPSLASPARVADPAASLRASVARVEAWCAQADARIAERERLLARGAELADLACLLAADPQTLPDPTLLAGAGALNVEARIHRLPAGAAAPAASSLPGDVIALPVAAPEGRFLVVLGRGASLATADATMTGLKSTRLAWPRDLRGDVATAAREIAARRTRVADALAQVDQTLRALDQEHGLADALAVVATIEWLIGHGAALAASGQLVWVTGWTSATRSDELCAPVLRQGLRCVTRFGEPPDGAEPPAYLANPRWARAFESFARMLGQPGRHEADPSALVALIAPLLFGFMFGDVGQGLVLCVIGWALRRRAPMLLMLVPGGAAAIAFGLAFGSVFAREDLIAAWWLHPLDEPVTLLVAAVALGAAILAGGLVLGAMQAFWRGAARRWWAADAGMAFAYFAALAAAARGEPALLWGVAIGALWFATGQARDAQTSRLAAFAGGIARFVEKGLQLSVNTVSFARVGAFALAHAGLSAAVVGVAEAAGTFAYWIVLAAGNLLILALEGLVVGIQTTRLLLFEFFVRFLEGTGRPFRPLSPPSIRQPSSSPGSP